MREHSLALPLTCEEKEISYTKFGGWGGKVGRWGGGGGGGGGGEDEVLDSCSVVNLQVTTAMKPVVTFRLSPSYLSGLKQDFCVYGNGEGP